MRVPISSRIDLALLVVVALLVPAAAGYLWVSLNRSCSGPRLGLPAHPLDLGRGRPGQVVDGSFQLTNRGDAPLRFQLSASCGCTDLSPRAGTIAPGESTIINVGIRLQEMGTERQVRVSVGTNEPDSPAAGYVVFAACPAPMTAPPALLTSAC